MASKKQDKPAPRLSKSDVERWEREHANDPELRVVAPLRATRLNDERAQALEHQPTRRSSGTYLPKGFADFDGYLVRAIVDGPPIVLGKRKAPPSAPSREQLNTIRTVLLNLTRALQAGRAGTEPYASAAAAAYKLLLGYAPGQYWRKLLADFLKDDALHRESVRRYKDPSPTPDPVARASAELTRKLLDGPPKPDEWGIPYGGTDQQVLAWLKRQAKVHHTELPPELTVAALKGMRDSVSPFGGGGGRGAVVRYSAERIIERFAAHRSKKETAPKPREKRESPMRKRSR